MRVGLVVLSAVIAGLAWGVVSSIDWTTACAVGIGAGALAIADLPRRWRQALLVGALTAAACAHGAGARTRGLSSPLLEWFDQTVGDERTAPAFEVEGTLRADAVQAESSIALAIDVERVRDGLEWRPARGRIAANVSGDLASPHLDEWTAGRHVVAPMLLKRVQGWRNPGSASEMLQRLRRPADLLGSVKSGALVSVRPGRWFDEWEAAARRRVRSTVDRTVGTRSRQSAAIVSAILIGDRGDLDPAVQQRLQVAGTYHVIAISGGNIAILTGVCLGLLRLVVRGPRLAALITMVVVVVYGSLVGNAPSVERAVVAACVYLTMSLVGLRPPGLNVLLTVAAIVGLADPLVVIDVGAWLSFGATLGIVVGATRFIAWATAQDAHAGPSARWARVLHVCWRAALGLLASTIAAELALTPILAAVFDRVSVAGLLLNFVAIPAMTVAQLAGMAAVAFDPLWPWAGRVSAAIAFAGAWALVESSKLVDLVPELSWRLPPPSWIWVASYYAAIVLALVAASRRFARAGWVCAFVCLLVIVTEPMTALRAPSPGWLRVSVLDVGQGDAIAVQFPSGQSLLIDAGGVPGAFDIGGRVVAPALWALGVRRLDWLALTHGDTDHSGGAKSVVRDFLPREIWEGVPVPTNERLLALRTDAGARGLVWRHLFAGHVFDVGSTTVSVVNPPAPDWERRKVRNDDSLVMRARLGDVEIVLPGDISRDAESTLPGEPGAPPLRLLKVPHHGSSTSSSMPFLRALLPQAAIISVGRSNLFGHPAADTLARYAQLGVEVFRTDRDGAVIIETDGREVRVRTMTGRTWTMTIARE